MHLSSSGGSSDASLLTEDVLLQRLERVEHSFIAAADAVFDFLRTSLGATKEKEPRHHVTVRGVLSLSLSGDFRGETLRTEIDDYSNDHWVIER